MHDGMHYDPIQGQGRFTNRTSKNQQHRNMLEHRRRQIADIDFVKK